MRVERSTFGFGLTAEKPGNARLAQAFPGSSRMSGMPQNAIVPDEELLEKARASAGSEQSARLVHELFQRYHQRVAIWCLRLTGDRESAADMAQDVFLKAFTALDSFQGKSKFSTWLYAIARNHCFNSARSSRRAGIEVEDEVLERIGDDSSLALFEEIDSRDSRRAFRDLLCKTLSDTERRVMVLHFVDELPLTAVTRLLDLENPSGAKAFIVSAKRKMKRALDRWKARDKRAGTAGSFPFAGSN